MASPGPSTGSADESNTASPPHAPRNGAESFASVVLPLADARKVFLLNRGVWDAVATEGPAVSYAVNAADIDTYVDVAGEFIRDLTR